MPAPSTLKRRPHDPGPDCRWLCRRNPGDRPARQHSRLYRSGRAAGVAQRLRPVRVQHDDDGHLVRDVDALGRGGNPTDRDAARFSSSSAAIRRPVIWRRFAFPITSTSLPTWRAARRPPCGSAPSPDCRDPDGSVWIHGSEGTLHFDRPSGRLCAGRRGDTALAEVAIAPEKAGEWQVEGGLRRIQSALGQPVRLTNFNDGVRTWNSPKPLPAARCRAEPSICRSDANDDRQAVRAPGARVQLTSSFSPSLSITPFHQRDLRVDELVELRRACRRRRTPPSAVKRSLVLGIVEPALHLGR